MVPAGESEPVATLWNLTWQGDRLSCVVYRADGGGMLLSIESPDAVVMTERFDLQPRMLARVKMLRAALMRRGWEDA
jgi:hypothetical protein